MLDTGTVIVSLVAGTAALVFVRYIQARKPVANYPPGPWGLPVVGNLLQIVKYPDFYRYFTELGEKYGNVYSCMLGHHNLVIVNGIDSIKEALLVRGNDFADRPDHLAIQLVNPRRLGIADAYFTDEWYNQRHFAHKTLRGFGFGKTSFESKIIEEVEFLIQHFKTICGNPTDVRNFVANSIANVICSITFGKRFDRFDDPQFLESMTCMRDLFMAAGSITIQLGHIYPILKPLLWKQINDIKNSKNYLQKFLLEQVARNEEKMDTASESENFIQSYLFEMKDDKEEKLSRDSLLYSILDLFAAGTETTSSTLLWGLLYMMMNPEVQRKVQKELDQVIGRETLPSWTHKPDLPYTEATLLEIQRLCSLVPVIPHATIKPTTLGGYNLPAKCEVWMNLWSVHHDPKLYPNPEKFDPNRFLTEDGQVKKTESFMPFGAGRRVCMGESLAKLELFLFFAGMLHQFSFSVPDEAVVPSLEGDMGLTLVPKPFEVLIKERH